MISHRQTLALPATSNYSSPGRKRKDHRHRSRCHHAEPHVNKFIPRKKPKRQKAPAGLESGDEKNTRLIQLTFSNRVLTVKRRRYGYLGEWCAHCRAFFE